MTPSVRRPSNRRHPRRLRGSVISVTALTVALFGSLLACSGDGDGEPDRSPQEVLAAAKEALDQTSGVTLSLRAKQLPEGVDGILEASGVATHAPAFDGDLTVVVNGLNVDVPVVSIDGIVFAKLPFTTSFSKLNPADYGAPDPAQLMDPTAGLSTWLVEANDIEEGDRIRAGEIVLSSYRGVLSGEVVDASIPSADESADFEVTFQIDDEGRLRTVEITGPFYGPDGTVDYTVSVDDYGTTTEITKP